MTRYAVMVLDLGGERPDLDIQEVADLTLTEILLGSHAEGFPDKVHVLQSRLQFGDVVGLVAVGSDRPVDLLRAAATDPSLVETPAVAWKPKRAERVQQLRDLQAVCMPEARKPREFTSYPLRQKFNPEHHADLVEKFRSFTLLRRKIDGGQDPGELCVDSHATTARLASLVASRDFDGTAGGVDIFDLIGRLDSIGLLELRVFMGIGG